MKLPRQRIDSVRIENETAGRIDRVDFARHLIELVDDASQVKERLEANPCPVCFLGGTMGGATVSERECAGCDEMLRSGNTCVDVLCAKCAAESQLCRRCGADVDLKYRRKRKLPGGVE